LDLGRTGPRSRRRRRSAAVTWIRRSSSPVAPPSDPPSAPPPGPPPPGSARCRRGRRRSRQIRPPRPRHRRIRRRGLHRGRPRLDLPAGTWICPVEKGKEELAADPASPAAPPPDLPPRPPAGPPSPGSAQRRRGRRGSRRIRPPRPRHRRIRRQGLRQGRRHLDLPGGEGEGGARGRSGLPRRTTAGPAAVHAWIHGRRPRSTPGSASVHTGALAWIRGRDAAPPRASSRRPPPVEGGGEGGGGPPVEGGRGGEEGRKRDVVPRARGPRGVVATAGWGRRGSEERERVAAGWGRSGGERERWSENPKTPVYISPINQNWIRASLVCLLGRGLFRGGPYNVSATENRFTVAGTLRRPPRLIGYFLWRAS